MYIYAIHIYMLYFILNRFGAFVVASVRKIVLNTMYIVTGASPIRLRARRTCNIVIIIGRETNAQAISNLNPRAVRIKTLSRTRTPLKKNNPFDLITSVRCLLLILFFFFLNSLMRSNYVWYLILFSFFLRPIKI